MVEYWIFFSFNCRYDVNTTPHHKVNYNSSDFIVPNIVHYIWYADLPKSLKYHQMLAILSSRKWIQPDIIYFHTNMPPIGKYWDSVKKIDRFKIIFRSPPQTLFGETIKPPYYEQSHSDVDRVKILMEYGGIYLDLDIFVIQSFDDLRKYPCTIGREREDKFCGGVIICSKNSPFLLLWMNSYFDDYRIEEWAYNSGKVPFNLAQRFPHLINVEENRINRPNPKELEFIWGQKKFNWSNNYALHLWYRSWIKSQFYKGVEPNETNIGAWRGVIGEIARSIIFNESNATNLTHMF